MPTTTIPPPKSKAGKKTKATALPVQQQAYTAPDSSGKHRYQFIKY